MGAWLGGFEQMERALNTIAASGADELGGYVLEAAAEQWVETAKQVMGHDTGQLDNRTQIVALSDTSAEVEADTPYASYHNDGTRFTVANGFWDAGQRAAGAVFTEFGVQYESVIAEALTSGGHPRPRSLL